MAVFKAFSWLVLSNLKANIREITLAAFLRPQVNFAGSSFNTRESLQVKNGSAVLREEGLSLF
jgi:hypothetical protein